MREADTFPFGSLQTRLCDYATVKRLKRLITLTICGGRISDSRAGEVEGRPWPKSRFLLRRVPQLSLRGTRKKCVVASRLHVRPLNH